MKTTTKLLLTGTVILASFAACNIDQKANEKACKPVNTVTKITEPFRFHKAIEVKPGLTLDVVSWGRGSESTGAYLILRSDSTHLKYKSISGELDGKIVDVWDMDMDSDGKPELYIQAKGEGEGSHLNMYIYEFDESGSNQELKFPELTSATKKSYRGIDSVYIKDGKLRREFPLFDEEDVTHKPTGGKKVLEYSLRGSTFKVEEIKQDTTGAQK